MQKTHSDMIFVQPQVRKIAHLRFKSGFVDVGKADYCLQSLVIYTLSAN